MNVNTHLFTLINFSFDPFITIRSQLHIIPERKQTTLFLRRSEATLLNLSSVGEKETIYGVLPQYEALELVVLNDFAQRIEDVVELPAELESRYGAGLVGSDVMWKCGVTLAWDRGKVALVDHEKFEKQFDSHFAVFGTGNMVPPIAISSLFVFRAFFCYYSSGNRLKFSNASSKI
ncbi:hypothetical protein BJ742DRAFT_900573 [Cladochytrium replicatum]|nr:hypothetical protein BJ742DRAFT_900573 [Cladochytrium replicatum]